MRLTDLLTTSLIKIGLESTEKEELFAEMINLFEVNGKITDRQAALDALFEREEKMSTGVARWVGLPHGKLEQVDGLLLALGISEKGIDYDSLLDDEPVYVVLTVLAEAGNPGPHIEALAEISRLLSIPGFIEKLREARTPQQILDYIKAEE